MKIRPVDKPGEMIDRVAQALHEVSSSDRSWASLPADGADGKSAYRERARIVLERMREPTYEMIFACVELYGSQVEFWHRSIDAALGVAAPPFSEEQKH